MIYGREYYWHQFHKQHATAEEIAHRRWNLVKQICYPLPQSVLDYGCGCGFFGMVVPDDIHVDTFDLIPGIGTGFRQMRYDLVTCFDVVEHIDWENSPRDGAILKNCLQTCRYAMFSLPILPPNIDMEDLTLGYAHWKHYLPGEHLMYWGRDEFLTFVWKQFGLNYCIYMGTRECPPREDIWTFIFERK